MSALNNEVFQNFEEGAHLHHSFPCVRRRHFAQSVSPQSFLRNFNCGGSTRIKQWKVFYWHRLLHHLDDFGSLKHGIINVLRISERITNVVKFVAKTRENC